MNMDCRSVDKRLVAFLQGELSPEEGPALDAHIRSCAGCGNKAALMRSVLRAAAAPEPQPDGFTEAVLGRTAREGRKWSFTGLLARLGAPQRSWRLAAAMSAALVLLALGLFTARRAPERTPLERAFPIATNVMISGAWGPQSPAAIEGCVSVMCTAL